MSTYTRVALNLRVLNKLMLSIVPVPKKQEEASNMEMREQNGAPFETTNFLMSREPTCCFLHFIEIFIPVAPTLIAIAGFSL